MSTLKLRLVTESTLQHDITKTLANIDDLCAMAINLHNSGPQGYQQFIELRDNFKASTAKTLTEYTTVSAIGSQRNICI